MKFLSTEPLNSTNEIDFIVKEISNSITDGLEKSAPKKKIQIHRYSYSSIVHNLIKQRNHFRNLYRRTLNKEYKLNFNHLNRVIKQQISKEKAQMFNDKIKNLSHTDNSLFQFTKALKKKGSYIPPLKYEHTTAYSEQEKANVLADSFAKCHQNSPKVCCF